jgi:hypothetical protein
MLCDAITGSDFKFLYIEKILAQPTTPDATLQLSCTLEIVNTLLQYQPPTFMAANISSISKIVGRCLKTNDAGVRKGLFDLMEKIVTTFPVHKPPSNSPDFANFYKSLRDHLMNQGLKPAATEGVVIDAPSAGSLHFVATVC